MKKLFTVALALLVVVLFTSQPALAKKKKKTHKKSLGSYGLPTGPAVLDGRYIVIMSGCNDCHTHNYMQSSGKVPQEDWLTGDTLGWRGPWGTTYAPNLRVLILGMSEDEWVKYAHALQARPPMPWFDLQLLMDRDLRAIYRFVKALGPKGEPAPAYVPPDQEPKPPFVLFPGTK